jgi:hypothetical protein
MLCERNQLDVSKIEELKTYHIANIFIKNRVLKATADVTVKKLKCDNIDKYSKAKSFLKKIPFVMDNCTMYIHRPMSDVKQVGAELSSRLLCWSVARHDKR